MCKSIWARFIACLSVVVVLSLSVMPLMTGAESPLSGDSWQAESNTFTPFYTLSSSLYDVLSAEIVEEFSAAVQYAYRGGMFGGGVPVAIGSIPVYDRDSLQYLWAPAIAVAYMPFFANPDTNASNEPPTKSNINTWLDMSIILTSGVYKVGFSNEYNWPFTTFIFVMSDAGDFIPYTNLSYSQNSNPGAYTQFQVEQTTTNLNPPQVQFRFWAFKPVNITLFGTATNMETAGAPRTSYSWYYNDESAAAQSIFDIGYGGRWVEPAPQTGGSTALLSFFVTCKQKYAVNASVYDDGYEEGIDEGYAEGRDQGFQSGYDEGYDAGFDPGYRQGYDDGYEEGLAQVPPVVLDIPSIFTAMFSGVHSIFQGFDINLFGISIGGMLLGILLVFLVAFVVKKIK